jgi:hypothetical protein
VEYFGTAAGGTRVTLTSYVATIVSFIVGMIGIWSLRILKTVTVRRIYVLSKLKFDIAR